MQQKAKSNCTFAPLLIGVTLLVGCNGKTAVTEVATGGKSAEVTCPIGAERCECYGNGTCNAGLTCASDLCVKLAATASLGGATSVGVTEGGSVSLGQGGAGGSPVPAAGGSPAGGLPGVGGASNTGGTNPTGGIASTGGATSTGGSIATGGAAPGSCTTTTNLIVEALASTSSNWIGGDPTSTQDDPCGVQGAVYAFSDTGLDRTPGNADDSVQTPPKDSAASDALARLSPCSTSKGGCCIAGTTSKWPTNGSITDYTASVWGGGLGVWLNDAGAARTKSAYQGPIRGFNVTVSGTLNGQVLRVGYAQSATDECPPFVQQTAVGTFAVPFTGTVVCPTWVCTPTCAPATAFPFSLRVQVVGGDVAGAFNICITSITPIL